MTSSGSIDEGLAIRCLWVRGTWIDWDGPSIWSFAVDRDLCDPACHRPRFGPVPVPLIRQPTLRFDAQSLDLEPGSPRKNFVRTPRSLFAARVSGASEVGGVD